MVGVPRSSGCHLCRKRHVKCDAARPGCANCLRYGAACPGYDRGLKFVESKHQIWRRSGRQGSLPWGSGAAPGDGSSLTALVAAPRPNKGEFISTLVVAIRTNTSLLDVTALARRAANCLKLFRIWYKEFKTLPGMPKDALSRGPGSPFLVVLHEIPWVGSMHMGYWASMLILQEALVQCQWPEVPG